MAQTNSVLLGARFVVRGFVFPVSYLASTGNQAGAFAECVFSLHCKHIAFELGNIGSSVSSLFGFVVAVFSRQGSRAKWCAYANCKLVVAVFAACWQFVFVLTAFVLAVNFSNSEVVRSANTVVGYFAIMGFNGSNNVVVKAFLCFVLECCANSPCAAVVTQTQTVNSAVIFLCSHAFCLCSFAIVTDSSRHANARECAVVEQTCGATFPRSISASNLFCQSCGAVNSFEAAVEFVHWCAVFTDAHFAKSTFQTDGGFAIESAISKFTISRVKTHFQSESCAQAVAQSLFAFKAQT